MPRSDGRAPDDLRPVTLEVDVQRAPAGSCRVTFGDTTVLCAATIVDGAPRWRERRGWVTGEYAMLPGATPDRAGRERKGPGGRSKEIERLIGRSLRSVVDLDRLPDVTVTVDCDVLDADGGTRTASITGGWVALARGLRAGATTPPSPARWLPCRSGSSTGNHAWTCPTRRTAAPRST